MSKPTVLIIDDEPDIRELIEITLARMNVESDAAGNVEEARSRLSEKTYDLCLTDLRLPDGSGIEIVRHIGRDHPQTPVAMFTAHGNMESAIEALKAGAFDFIAKPVELQDLRKLIDQALRLGPPADPSENKQLLGDSPLMKELRTRITKVARSQAPVAIGGESGVGKELVARSIHMQSPRANGPFVPLNCGAIPRELMESELFGHERGSFTGAVASNEGLFVAANGGTLFLDEVAELPMDMQVKLLRAIQEKSIRPVGATQEISIDVRFLSASHRNLGAEVQAGRLREDLFYRINVIELHVPPLRERTEDIPILADATLCRLATEHGRETPTLSESALKQLRLHPFPGNVRELENILERALTLSESDRITVDDLHMAAPEPAGGTRNANARDCTADEQGDAGAGQPASDSLDERLADEQRRVLRATLEEHRWNRAETARSLGLTYRQLRYRLRKLGID